VPQSEHFPKGLDFFQAARNHLLYQTLIGDAIARVVESQHYFYVKKRLDE
jgi:hypothetical protein